MANRSIILGITLAATMAATVGSGLWYDNHRSADREPTGQSNLNVIEQALESRAPKDLEVPRPNGPLTVTILGDSLTNSWGATADSKGYRPQLIDAWSQGGPVIPAISAVSGATLSEVAAVANIPADTDVLIVELGTNDNGEVPTDPNLFRQQYKALMARASSIAPNAAVVCLGTWREESSGAMLDSVIATECAGRFLTLRDIYQDADSRGPEGRPSYLGTGVGDRFHPNDIGYAAIKDRIADNVIVVSPNVGS